MAKIVFYEKKNCKLCSKTIKHNYGEGLRDWVRRKFCNHKCFSKYNSGKNNASYKRGYRIRPDGYLRDSSDRYLHRLVLESFLKRRLRRYEHVHHIDGNKKNNDIKNLVILTNSEHRKLEMQYAKRDKYGRFY